MKPNQIAKLLNSLDKQRTGITTILEEDLSNCVEFGKEWEQLDVENQHKNYAQLVQLVGHIEIAAREYARDLPLKPKSFIEYADVVERIYQSVPDFSEVETSLVNGQSYDDGVYNGTDVSTIFFNERSTYKIQWSKALQGLNQSFRSADDVINFWDGVQIEVRNTIHDGNYDCQMSGLLNMIAETIYDETQGLDLANKTGIRAVNVLKIYNDKMDEANKLTIDDVKNDPDFERFFSQIVREYVKRLSDRQTAFNMGHLKRRTPKEKMNLILIDDVLTAMDTYLYSDTKHEKYVLMPEAKTVLSWEGVKSDSGLFDFRSLTEVNVKNSLGHAVKANVLGVLMDDDACFVASGNYRAYSKPIYSGEFINYWNYFDTKICNNKNENFVVFYVA